ncbi:MAG: HAD-IA family hydrolase [Xanthomonadales bacterium]|nr:HAD-IA family hydrolase [Xanthomonadales bacterium]
MAGRFRCVLFDLDGTLVDTAPDMVGTAQDMQQEEGRQLGDYQHLRRFVSRGSMGVIKAAFENDSEAAQKDRVPRFLELYSRRLSRHSRLFEGMAPVLDEIERRGACWGVVTNKPGWLTGPLMQDLGLANRAATVVCGDTLARRKPDPDPVLHAMREAGADAEATVFLGDDQRDVVAGRAAGVTTVAAAYGYLPPGEQIEDWKADAVVRHPSEISALLEALGSV